VVCGRNFTVALNGIGQVLQMGSTGAVNPREHQALWEGAWMPVIVGGPLAGALGMVGSGFGGSCGGVLGGCGACMDSCVW